MTFLQNEMHMSCLLTDACGKFEPHPMFGRILSKSVNYCFFPQGDESATTRNFLKLTMDGLSAADLRIPMSRKPCSGSYLSQRGYRFRPRSVWVLMPRPADDR